MAGGRSARAGLTLDDERGGGNGGGQDVTTTTIIIIVIVILNIIRVTAPRRQVIKYFKKENMINGVNSFTP